MAQPEYPALLLDAGTPLLQTGVLAEGRWLAFEQQEGDAITLLPELVRSVLAQSGLEIDRMQSFIHCEGPGSLLGLRLAAMLMRTWRALPGPGGKPLFAYRTLPMAAAIAQLSRNEAPDIVATPFRRGSYCAWERTGDTYRILDDAGLESVGNAVGMIEQRHTKGIPPRCSIILPYDLSKLPDLISKSLAPLHPATQADAFTPAPSEYKLWTGERHRISKP